MTAHHFRLTPTLLLGLVLFVSATPAPVAQSPDTGRLESLIDEYWTRTLDQAPLLRLKYGLPVEELPEISLEQARRDAAFGESLAARLEAISPASLSEADRL